MATLTLSEAQNQLETLFQAATHGEEIFITDGQKRWVQLVPHNKQPRRRQFGSARGLILIGEDLNAPLDDFADYTR